MRDEGRPTKELPSCCCLACALLATHPGAPAALRAGWNAPAGRYRYMASLRRTSAAGSNANSHFCGGTAGRRGGGFGGSAH